MIFRYKTLLFLALILFLPMWVNAETRNIVFPINGEATFRDDFLEPRSGGARQHLGIDVIADKMTPLVAAVDGVISFIPYPEPSYGYMITIQDEDRYQYRYLHINNDNPGTDDGNGGRQYAYAQGLKRGSEVKAGQLIGWVGDSGNAEATVSHLHFEIRTPSKSAINPYDSLFSAASPENFAEVYVDTGQIDSGDVGLDEGAELIFTIELKEGMQGEAIRELQTRLKEAGHFSHALTNYFGPITKGALQSYQRANNIAPSGILGFETRAFINGDPLTASGLVRLEKELFEGDEGDAVLQVQLKLKELGYYEGETNGKFDSVLRENIRKFQNENGVTPTGYINYDSWNKLNSVYKATPKNIPPPKTYPEANAFAFTKTLSTGSRGDDVIALQDRLRELGHFSPNIISTGYFGPVTREAVISFQSENGIETVGYVGPQTHSAIFSSNTQAELLPAIVASAPETPTSSSNNYVFTKDMKIGSRGSEVMALQDKLRDLGHFSPNIISTGYFGSVTYNAVIKFQSSNGIEAIGIVGPKTRAALNN